MAEGVWKIRVGENASQKGVGSHNRSQLSEPMKQSQIPLRGYEIKMRRT